MNRPFLLSVFIIALVSLSGCTKTPADQCLESFKKDLVSPNSAKVFDFNEGKLIYLAKNRNGVEIQGRAICIKIGEKWMRSAQHEYLEILNLATSSLEANNNCRRKGETKSVCDSLHKIITQDAARYELGFN